jgi:hypothetical protein
MHDYIIWYPGGTSYETFWIEYRLSQQFDLIFFDQSERTTSGIPPVVSKYDQRKKIALIQNKSIRLSTTQNCDPSMLDPNITLCDYDLVIVYTAESINMDWTSYRQAVETQLHTDRIIYMVGGHVESSNPDPDICYVQHRLVPKDQTFLDVFDRLIEQKTYVIDQLGKISNFIYNHKFLSDQYALHADKSFYYTDTDTHRVWTNPQHVKNTEYFVWNPHNWWEFEYALKKGKEFFPNAEICKDWPCPAGTRFQGDSRKKIALLFLEKIYLPWTRPHKLPDPEQQGISNLHMGWADLVIIYTTENLHNWWPIVYGEICSQLHTDRIVLCTAGGVSYSNPDPNLVFVNHQSLLSYVAAGNEFVDVNEVTVPFRKSMFDCLMGTVKLSRIALFYRLLDSNFLDEPIHTLVNLQPNPHGDLSDLDWDIVRNYMPDSFARHGMVTDFASPELFELEEDVVKEFKIKTQQESADKRYSINKLPRPGFGLPGDSIMMSCVVPWKVYQSSWYSIVCETNDIITTSQFVTEKLGKCLFAKRIFIVIGGGNTLSYLRSLGFKTFHSDVIDESYDSEPDWQRRVDLAWKQIQRLRSTEPRSAYAYFRDVLEHNHKLMLNWPDKQFEEISQFLQKKLVQI